MKLVLDRLQSLRARGVWPGGARDLWTDALGVLCLLNLHSEMEEMRYLEEAQVVALNVDRILGRRKGICLGEGPESEGQTFRSLALWIYALRTLGEYRPHFRLRALSLVREIHSSFVRPGSGIVTRMDENLRAPFPGAETGKVEVFLGFGVYRLLDEGALAPEVEEMEGLVGRACASLAPDQGLDLGLLLWITHFFPGEGWAVNLRERCLSALDARWILPPGYFRRNLPEPRVAPHRPDILALTNLTTAIGLRAHGIWAERTDRIQRYFLENYAWEDPEDPLSSILTCVSLLPGVLLARHATTP